MNLAVRRGFFDAQSALGLRFPAAAALASLLALTLLSVLERPAVPGIGGVRSEPSLLLLTAFGLVVPLVSYALQARVGGRLEQLMMADWPRRGGDRRLYALGRLGLPLLLGSAVAISVGAWALIGSFAAAPTAAATGTGLPVQLLAVALVAVLGACSYGAAFALADLWWGRTGRALYLVLDWLLGSGVGLAALPWPRAHLRYLIGGPPAVGVNPLEAGQILLALSLLWTLLYVRRVPR